MPSHDTVVLSLPFRETWQAQNSPARRIPSHGTHVFATTYAIAFVATQDGRSAAVRDWRTVLGTEPNERFYAFGRPILSPADGVVSAMHDGEPDHAARRSPLTLVSYLASQASRAQSGAAALAGNHVVVELAGGGRFVVLAHLKHSSIRVRPGDRVQVGQHLGDCGNSGNSTQPHLHLQVMDELDPFAARGVPIAFRSFRAWSRPSEPPRVVTEGLPNEAETVEVC